MYGEKSISREWRDFAISALVVFVIGFAIHAFTYIKLVDAAKETSGGYTLVDKGRDCGRTCYYWGIFQNDETGKVATTNIGIIGHRYYEVDQSYLFNNDVVYPFGISGGAAYNPARVSTPIGFGTSLLAVITIIAAGCAVFGFIASKLSGEK